MPQVPFSGVPSVVGGGSQPQSRYQADVNADVFGGNVGRAIESLGGDLKAGGNELFNRGIAMQDLFNHSEAQEADAKYMVKAGELHAQYNTLQGKDAVAAYPQFQKDLADARKAVRDGLSNPMSQKLFDSQSLGTLSKSIFNGASHAASQNKKFAVDSNESQIAAATNDAAVSSDPRQIEQARQKLKSLSRERSALLGQDDNTASLQEKTINSSLDFHVIDHMAKADPFKAADELEKRKSGMTAKDYDRALTIVDNTKRSVGSVNIAQEVVSSHIGEDGKPDVSFDEMQKEAEKRAKAAAPDDAIMVKHTVDALRGLYNQKIYADKQFRWETTQTVDAGIQNGAKDIQELRAQSPEMAKAIDALPKSDQLKLPARINAYNSARDKVASQTSLTRLSGLRNNDVEAFLNVDPTDPALALNQPQQRQVLDWQRSLKKDQNNDPRVGRAMTWLREARGGELTALGVFKRDNKNPDDYDHLTGAMSSALDLWRESKGKPAEREDIVNTIGPGLIKSRAVAGWLYGTNNEPFFKPDRYSEEYKLFKRKTTEDITNRGEPAPSDAEVDRGFTRVQLLRLYPKKASNASGK